MLKPDPNAATVVAAPSAWVAPAIFVAFPLPVVVVDVEAHLRGILVLFFDVPAVAFIIANPRRLMRLTQSKRGHRRPL